MQQGQTLSNSEKGKKFEEGPANNSKRFSHNVLREALKKEDTPANLPAQTVFSQTSNTPATSASLAKENA